jgi:hypothetical protein
MRGSRVKALRRELRIKLGRAPQGATLIKHGTIYGNEFRPIKKQYIRERAK